MVPGKACLNSLVMHHFTMASPMACKWVSALSMPAAPHVTGHPIAWTPQFVLRNGFVPDRAAAQHLLPAELVSVSPSAHSLLTCRRCAVERHPTCCACWVPHWTAWALLQLRQLMSWRSNCGRWSWGGCRPAARLPKWARYCTLLVRHIVLHSWILLDAVRESRVQTACLLGSTGTLVCWVKLLVHKCINHTSAQVHKSQARRAISSMSACPSCRRS